MGISIASPEDLSRKLSNTLCLYDGIPVSVSQSSRSELDVVISPTDPDNLDKIGFRKKIIKTTDPKLEVFNIPLGYFYAPNTDACYYVTRSTRRTYNHGLLPSNLRRGTNINSTLSIDFSRCVLGQHYDAEKAFKMVADGESVKVPFHRYFAFSSDGEQVYLLYRDVPVAYNSTDRMNEFNIYNNSTTSITLREIEKHGFIRLIR